jgi:transposase
MVESEKRKESDLEKLEDKLVKEGEELSSELMLSEYKAQQSCERGFRFLKDPLFLADKLLRI